MSDIPFNLGVVQARMAAACRTAGRAPGAVRLLAVSKTRPASDVAAAHAAGQSAFGENYVQEAVNKIRTLSHLPLEWHLIGPLQSNKTAETAQYFDWVHTVDRLKIAQRLSAQRPAGREPLNICLQVNIDGEDSKSGCPPEETEALARAVLALPNLRLRGLMAIPRPGNPAALAALAALRDRLLANIPALNTAGFDTLSMGMSDDLEAAIAAGSTLVRVGTAIFGERVRQTERE
jgi:pyridoxal phosphate enzyme (YggS family)